MTIENEEAPTLTKYGRMRERYLREHKKVLYCNLLTSGKLYEHLAEIDTSACNMAEYLIKEMAKKQGVTEQLKVEDMMRWVGLMNNIRACADEIVLNDIVYAIPCWFHFAVMESSDTHGRTTTRQWVNGESRCRQH